MTALAKAPFAQIAVLLQKPLESLDLPSLRLLEEFHTMNMEHARAALDPIRGEIAIRHRHAAQGRQLKVDPHGIYECPNCGTENDTTRGFRTCGTCGADWTKALAAAGIPEEG